MKVYLNETAIGHCSPVTVDRSPATMYMSSNKSDNMGPSVVRLGQNGRGNATSQNGDNERLYPHSFKNVV